MIKCTLGLRHTIGQPILKLGFSGQNMKYTHKHIANSQWKLVSIKHKFWMKYTQKYKEHKVNQWKMRY